jgi:hypothetical protein
VDDAAWTDGGTAEQMIIADNDSTRKLLSNLSASCNGGACPSVSSADVDPNSSPMIWNGFVWYGNGTSSTGNVERHPLVGDGTIGAASTLSGTPTARPFWGLITDGTNAYAVTHRNSGSTSNLDLFAITAGFALGTLDWTSAHLSAEPTVDINGKLTTSDFSGNVSTVTPSTAGGSPVTIASPGGTPRVPLQGSDGHDYIPDNTASGALFAYEGRQLSWELVIPGTTLPRAAAMDCSGRIFVANGGTVYALVSDDHGLADTPWPNLRRDARNTGNASAPKYGIRTAGGCSQ